MKFFLPIIYLLCISRSVFGKKIERERRNNDDELSYQELKNMNFSCNSWGSCMQPRPDGPPVIEFGYKCSCHTQCWEYGTCCIDSPHKVKPPIQKCVTNNYGSYYMVHRCPVNVHPDSIWRSNCEFEFNWLSDFRTIDDILMLAPVTSLNSSRTYKNYYCFRCHESTDNYVFWNSEVTGDYNALNGKIVHSVAFNETLKNWVAILEESHVSVPVSMRFLLNKQAEPKACKTIKADCPKRADERLNSKCLAYTAVLYMNSITFKNVHCALCRNIPLADLTCDPDASFEEGRRYGGGYGGGGRDRGGYPGGLRGGAGGRYGGGGYHLPKFKTLIMVGHKEGRNPRNSEDEVWVPQLNRFVKTRCPQHLPVLRNGICG